MTDGQYPDGDPYGRGVPDEVYGTGGPHAYPAYEAGAYSNAPGTGYAEGSYDSGAWQTPAYDGAAYTQDSYSGTSGAHQAYQGYETPAYDTSGYSTPVYDSGATAVYDSGAYAAYGSYQSYDAAPDNSGAHQAYDPSAYDTSYGQTASIPQQPAESAYDTAAWSGDVMTAAPGQAAAWSADPWGTDATASGTWSAPAADMWSGDNRLGAEAYTDDYRNDAAATGWYDAAAVQETAPAYDGTAWQETSAWHNADAEPAQSGSPAFVSFGADSATLFRPSAEAYGDDEATAAFSADFAAAAGSAAEPDADYADDADGYDDSAGSPDDEATALFPAQAAGAAAAGAAAGTVKRAAGGSGTGSRAARRKTTKRTRPMARVAGGSLGVLGAAAMAVAAAGGIQAADTQGTGDDTVTLGADVPLSSPLDQQFTDLRDGAEDFADRASRAQTRIALQERAEELARQQEAERKKREELRPKYALPVKPGLSAYFGQAGGRWSNLHTGIDFPVDRGTPVRAVTDGVVRTEFNRAYGNMVILTAPDGTETWYCHLTRAKVVSGPVKAGDVIAYSGNSGNSSGPHLHLEVRPGGGAPINPIPWLRAKGLDPVG
ncbi:M23 family metallopeptidase [Yinghuangia soli]|uniref:Peptidoglycan DD-metalloendopeptidase family protein n=1 Tax=Yinghuangia soli TaxID=2908204 RepID=A0AA41Q4P4_9ACTN|nr:M23 family metallopeptidase [Yinghuangia soli]MCF2530052.1 peptidoglycan DD-metalloendopeptidase family protein [Yinghuangia soli]